jgi:hypothetical protein
MENIENAETPKSKKHIRSEKQIEAFERMRLKRLEMCRLRREEIQAVLEKYKKTKAT